MSFIHINIVASKKSINIFNCTIACQFHRIESCYFQDCSDVQIWTWTDLLIPPNPLLKDAFFRRCSLVSKMTGDSFQNWWSIIEFPWKFNIDTQKVAILERRYLKKKSIVLVSIHRIKLWPNSLDHFKTTFLSSNCRNFQGTFGEKMPNVPADQNGWFLAICLHHLRKSSRLRTGTEKMARFWMVNLK